MKKFYIMACDIGGTQCRAVVADSGCKVLSRADSSTKKVSGKNIPLLAITALQEALNKAKKQHKISKISAIAASIAGYCDSKKGIVVFSPNISNGKNIQMHLIGKKFKAPFLLYNDGNAAALGVLKLDPKAKGMKNLIYVIMGSGIGSGIVIDGKIYTGTNGFAGEIGHMVIKEDGRLCSCGKKGCWEAYCSGSSIEKIAFEQTKKRLTSKQIFDLAKKGNKTAKELLQEVSKHNITAIKNIISIFDPEAIFFGESLLKNENQILAPIRKSLANLPRNQPKILRASVQEPALCGAVWLAVDSCRSKSVH